MFLRLKMGDVNSLLQQHGVFYPDSVSQSLRAAILQGHVKLLKPEEDPEGKFGLDQVRLVVWAWPVSLIGKEGDHL